VVERDLQQILTKLDQLYVLKPGSIGEPTQYLGVEIGKYPLPNKPERPVWYIISENYGKEAIWTMKKWLEE
jgi:hypothetical protein